MTCNEERVDMLSQMTIFVKGVILCKSVEEMEKLYETAVALNDRLGLSKNVSTQRMLQQDRTLCNEIKKLSEKLGRFPCIFELRRLGQEMAKNSSETYGIISSVLESSWGLPGHIHDFFNQGMNCTWDWDKKRNRWKIYRKCPVCKSNHYMFE